jgi:hypothetical protein
MSELDWRFNCSPEEIQVFGFRSENQKLVVMSCEADHSEYTHHDWLNSVQDDSADYPIVCDSYSETRVPTTASCEGNASQYIGIIAQGGGECQGSTRDEMQSRLSPVSGRHSP